MISEEINLIKKFKSKKVLVIGELIIDAYFKGSCNRIAPEASVPVIDIQEKNYCLGGAANVAANLSALGAEVFFISVCGNDEHAEMAFKLLASAGIKSNLIVKSKKRSTLFKTRISSDSQLLVRFDEGSTALLDSDTEQLVIQQLKSIYAEIDGVFIADYGKGIMGTNLIDEIGKLNATGRKIIALDSKNTGQYFHIKPNLLKPNFQEAAALMDYKSSIRPALEEMYTWGESLYRKTAAEAIFLTLDEQGVCVFDQGKFRFHKAVLAVANPSVSGAGDTFLATAMMAFASGADLASVTGLAITAAHQVVSKPQTAVLNLTEWMQGFSSQSKLMQNQKYIREAVALLKIQGKKIVFTNGCFDILHSGHVSYLKGAKARGDVLIVGLNNDESIKRLKGESRPINKLQDRVEVLSELSCIDFIIPFGKAGDDTPKSLLKLVKPNVFVKGGDYQGKYLPEGEILKKMGCEIIFLPMVAGRSTTKTISKIRESSAFVSPITVN
jgi:D-beta-D-heptose 7-phosphate kinase/D-beta-D-heptose 1-phosphate adenosyltransferase